MAAWTMTSGVGKSGSPAPKPITGRPAALRALALASTARVADSEIAPTRAETRRSVGGVAALMDPSFQTGNPRGTGVSRTEQHRANPWTPVRIDAAATARRDDLPPGWCFPGAFRSTPGPGTRTLSPRWPSAARAQPVHTKHPAGCGTLGDAQRVVAQLVEHWSPKPAVGGSSPSGPATHTFARMCAHVRTAMHRRAAQ